MKVEGLTDEQLRRRSMPPSTLSLLGLVRHLAEVERTWFRRVVNGEYARHNGHADFLREGVDGTVGP